jgi:hypothetical protein
MNDSTTAPENSMKSVGKAISGPIGIASLATFIYKINSAFNASSPVHFRTRA